MSSLIANLVINGLLVGLLTATVIYCIILNRRIQTLQDSKSELAALLQQFDESTVRASETIIAMQTASKKIGDNIQMRIDKANYLLDDLTYTIEKGTRLTKQIDASFAINRARSKVTGSEETVNLQEPPTTPIPVAANEKQNEPQEKGDRTLKQSVSKRNTSSLEAILEKVVSRKQMQHPDARSTVAQGHEAMSVKSRAEQDLIELIRASKG